jgi:hypothetical protein
VTPNDIAPLRNAIRHSERFVMKKGVTPVLHTTFSEHPPTMREQFASLDDVTIEEMEVEG